MNNDGQRKEWPGVSVVVVSKNRREELKKALNSLRKVNYPKDRLEIVVVEEADSPQEIEGVKYVFIPYKERMDFGYARNVGVKNTTHSIIAWTDDDCIVDKNWLKELASCFNGNIVGVAGAVLVRNTNAIGYCENVLGFPGGGLKKIHMTKGKIITTEQLSTCNCAYRKRLFEEIGYFKEDTPYSGEDYDFAQRVIRKYKCLYNPKAVVYHKPRESLWRIFRWFNRRGICETYLIKMKTNRLIPHIWYNIKTSLIIRLIILVFILYLLGQNKLGVYLTLFIIYYLVILFRYRFQLRSLKKVKVFFLTPIVKLTMDLGMEWGKILGPFVYLHHKRRT